MTWLAKFRVEEKTVFPTLVLAKDRGEQKRKPNGELEKAHTRGQPLMSGPPGPAWARDHPTCVWVELKFPMVVAIHNFILDLCVFCIVPRQCWQVEDLCTHSHVFFYHGHIFRGQENRQIFIQIHNGDSDSAKSREGFRGAPVGSTDCQLKCWVLRILQRLFQTDNPRGFLNWKVSIGGVRERIDHLSIETWKDKGQAAFNS